MNSPTEVPIISEAGQTPTLWINDINDELEFDSAQSAYHALRGVLFALRDRIMPEEAVHLGDQLPVLIRGIYYEAYALGGKPEKIRNLDEFLKKIEHETQQVDPAPTPQAALKAVTRVLARYVDENQYHHVKHALPAEIQESLGQ